MAEFITESVAANFYAVAWNKLDVGIIKELLDENVEYILKKNNQSLKGRKDLLIYLQKNMNRIKKHVLRIGKCRFSTVYKGIPVRNTKMT